MIAPSGKEIAIAAKDQPVVVVEVGGGLRSYSVGGCELLDGYGADEMSSSGRREKLRGVRSIGIVVTRQTVIPIGCSHY
jgi:hypothetical protein